MKKILVLAIAIISLSLFPGVFHLILENADAQTITLRISHTGPEKETSMQHLWSIKMKETIESRTSGKVKIEIYPVGQLYNDDEALVALSRGEIFGTNTTTGVLSSWNDKLNIFDLYGLFSSRDQLRGFLQLDSVKNQMTRPLTEKGLDATLIPSFYWYAFTKKPIKSMADFKGLKMRVVPNRAQLASLKAIGGEPTPVPVAELYTALQRGTVDGAVTVQVGIYGRSIQEVVKYALEDPVMFTAAQPAVLSMAQLKKLPPDIRKIVEQANVDVLKYVEDNIFQKEKEQVTKGLLDAGVTFTKMPEQEKGKFFDAVKESWKDLAPLIGQDLIDEAIKSRR